MQYPTFQCRSLPQAPAHLSVGQVRASLAALSMTLLLCSCRGLAPNGPALIAAAPPDAAQATDAPAAQPSVVRSRPQAENRATDAAVETASGPLAVVPLAPMVAPIPQGIVTPWKPPGIVGPWPADEYLWDGGEKYPVVVDSNLEIKGLALEDTVVHYDTIDGRTVVEPSNRVVLYAPRFGAVRQVTAALASHQEQRLVQADIPVGPIQFEEDQTAGTALQPVQPVGEIGLKLVSIEKGNQLPVRVSSRLRPATMEDHLLPFEDFDIIRLGMFAQSEQAEVQERHRVRHRLVARSGGAGDSRRTIGGRRNRRPAGASHLYHRHAQSSPLAGDQTGLHDDGPAGRVCRFHDSIRQHRRPEDRQRDVGRQLDHAAGICGRKRRGESDGRLFGHSQPGRLVAFAVGVRRPGRGRRRRHCPFPLPGARKVGRRPLAACQTPGICRLPAALVSLPTLG